MCRRRATAEGLPAEAASAASADDVSNCRLRAPRPRLAGGQEAACAANSASCLRFDHFGPLSVFIQQLPQELGLQCMPHQLLLLLALRVAKGWSLCSKRGAYWCRGGTSSSCWPLMCPPRRARSSVCTCRATTPSTTEVSACLTHATFSGFSGFSGFTPRLFTFLRGAHHTLLAIHGVYAMLMAQDALGPARWRVSAYPAALLFLMLFPVSQTNKNVATHHALGVCKLSPSRVLSTMLWRPFTQPYLPDSLTRR